MGREEVTPSAACLLLRQAVRGKQQVGRVRRGLAGQHMHHIAQIHRAQHGPHLGRVVVCPLAEHEHLGVVVHGEGLLGELVVHREARVAQGQGREGSALNSPPWAASGGPGGGARAKTRRVLEHGHQVVAQVAREGAHLSDVVAGLNAHPRGATQQVPVVRAHQGEAFGEARQAAPLAAGGDEQHIGLVQDVVETLTLVLVVVPVHLEVQALVDAAEAVVTVHPQGQAVVPGGLVGDEGALHLHRAPVHPHGQAVGLPFLKVHRLIQGEQGIHRDGVFLTGEGEVPLGASDPLGLGVAHRGQFHAQGQRFPTGVRPDEAENPNVGHRAAGAGDKENLQRFVRLDAAVFGTHGLGRGAVGGLDGQGEGAGDVGVNPAAGGDARVGAGVDAGEAPGPEKGQRHHAQGAGPGEGAAPGPAAGFGQAHPAPGGQDGQAGVHRQQVAHGGVPDEGLPDQVEGRPGPEHRVARPIAAPQAEPHAH